MRPECTCPQITCSKGFSFLVALWSQCTCFYALSLPLNQICGSRYHIGRKRCIILFSGMSAPDNQLEKTAFAFVIFHLPLFLPALLSFLLNVFAFFLSLLLCLLLSYNIMCFHSILLLYIILCLNPFFSSFSSVFHCFSSFSSLPLLLLQHHL